MKRNVGWMLGTAIHNFIIAPASQDFQIDDKMMRFYNDSEMVFRT